jgi:hypothetical protein
MSEIYGIMTQGQRDLIVPQLIETMHLSDRLMQGVSA